LPIYRAFARDAQFLSSAVYIDSCFAIKAAVSDQTYHTECRALAEILTNPKYRVIYSDFLLIDAWNGIVNMYVEAAFERQRAGQYGYGLTLYEFKKSQPALLTNLFPDIIKAYQAFNYLLRSFRRMVVPVTPAIRTAALKFMRDLGLYPADAVHAATAAGERAMDIITLDSDYAVLPKTFSVWNPDAITRKLESRQAR